MPSLRDESSSSDEDDGNSGADTFLAEAAVSNHDDVLLGGRRQLRPPRNLPVIQAAAIFASSTSSLPTERARPGGAVDTPANLAGSDEDTLVVEDGVIVLRGDVERR
jgi:hypothetical protein